MSAALPLLLLLLSACGRERAPESPSVLLVTFDTTRRDFLGFAGRRPSPTPNLDALAEKAVVFEDAYAAAPLTLPSHTTLMTGLLPRSHGVHDNGTFRVPEEAVTLAESLRDAGYDTAACVAAYVLDPDFGLDQGFRVYDAVPREPDDSGRMRLAQRPADAMVDRALEVLEELEAPFFLWLHLFDPHAPYEPPGATAADDLRGLYEGEIRFADAQLGRLLDALEDRGLLEQLVIAFAADHGESLGDDREPTHGYFVGEHTMRVPLFLRVPGVAPRRVPALVSLADVAPTLWSLLDLPGPGGAQDGRDLAQNLRNPALPWPEDPVVLESYGGWQAFGTAPFEAVIQGRWKYVRSARRELFDRLTDPGEQDDRSESPDAPLSAMADLYERIFADSSARLSPTPVTLDASEVQELEALGYAVGHPGAEGRPDFDALPDLLARTELIAGHQAAMNAVERGDLETALREFQRLVEAAPHSALFHERVGGLLLSQAPERFEEARTHFQAALRIEFERPLSHLGLAQCAYRAAEAETDALRQLAARGRRNDAITVQQRQQAALREAVAHYRMVLDLEPSQPQALIGVAYITQNAAEDWARAGQNERAAGMLREALADLERYLEVIPRDHPEWRRHEAMRGRWRERLRELDG